MCTLSQLNVYFAHIETTKLAGHNTLNLGNVQSVQTFSHNIEFKALCEQNTVLYHIAMLYSICICNVFVFVFDLYFQCICIVVVLY